MCIRDSHDRAHDGWFVLAKRLLVRHVSPARPPDHQEEPEDSLLSRERDILVEILRSPWPNLDSLGWPRRKRFQYDEDPVRDENSATNTADRKAWDDALFDELYPGLQVGSASEMGYRAMPFVLRMWLEARDVESNQNISG